jgi:hypothetical protein
MRTIPLELQAESSKDVTQAQHLITVTTREYIYRWTDGQNSIFYNGDWWVTKGITFDTLGMTLTGQLDSLTLEIDNANMEFSDLVLEEDIRGSLCDISLVYLDNNLKVIGEPVVLFQGFLDKMPIDRAKGRVEVFSHMIRWKLLTPRRQHTPSCPWVFKGAGCEYAGELYINPISDILAGFTRSHLNSNYKCVDDRLNDLCIGQTFSADSDDGTHVAANAFDDDVATWWASANTAVYHWLQVHFAVAKIITKYKIIQYSSAYSPIDFRLQGSNDGGSTWKDLDIRVGVSWGNETFKSFDFGSTVAYADYRLYVDRITGGANLVEIKGFELSGPSDQVNDSEYNSTNNTATKADVFGIPPIALSPEVTGIIVTVRVRAKQVTASGRNLAGRIRMSGVDYDASALTPATSPTNYDFFWLINPSTGVAWTPDDFNLDPFTKLLLHFEGATGDKPSKDDTGQTVNWVGNAQVSTVQKKFGNGSLLLDGSGAYIHVPDSDAWYFGLQDFTIDLWVRFNAIVASNPLVSQQTNNDNEFRLTASTTSLGFTVYSGASLIINVSGAWSPVINTWYHVALVRSGSSWYLFVNGSVINSPYTNTNAMPDFSGSLIVGLSDGGAYYSNAYFDEIRVSKGIARWTAGFSQPTTPYPYGVKIGYSVPADAGGHEVDVEECYLKITNDIAALLCDLTPERCLALNNRDQYGGFVYIPELQTKEFWWGTKQKVWGGGI